MSSETATCEIDDDELRIDGLTVHDEKVIEYLGEDPTPEDVRRALRVGAQALRSAETAGEVDLVDSRFQQFESQVEDSISTLRDEIDHTFKNDNAEVKLALEDFVDSLEETLSNRLGDDGEFLREALHHEKEESPLHAIRNEIRELHRELKEAQGRAEERKYSTRKGGDFEEAVEEALQDMHIGPMADLEPTGTGTGSKGSSKKGDFEVTTKTDQVITIEAKDRTSQLSKSEIADYLEKARKNREADYAMMVMRNAGGVPTSKMGWFHEFDRQRLCIVLSNGPDDDIDWRFLNFGYNWARARVAAMQRSADKTDPEAIGDELQQLREQINDFESIRNNAETIRETAVEIEGELDTLESRLRANIRDLNAELGIAE